MYKHSQKQFLGFTLAEVLIVMGIVGIIAQITLPPLVADIKDAQYKSAFKKQFSVLSAALNEIRYDKGGDLANAFTSSSNTVSTLGSKLSVAQYCLAGGAGNCWATYVTTFHGDVTTATASPKMTLSDGTFMWVNLISAACTSDRGKGPISCGTVDMDVNGFTPPNQYGRDIFMVEITRDGLYPGGQFSYTGNCSRTDTGIRSGWGCAVRALKGINY